MMSSPLFQRLSDLIAAVQLSLSDSRTGLCFCFIKDTVLHQIVPEGIGTTLERAAGIDQAAVVLEKDAGVVCPLAERYLIMVTPVDLPCIYCEELLPLHIEES